MYPQTAEAGQIQANNWPISEYKVIEMLRCWTFAKHGRGYQIAGSACRWTDGHFSVTTKIDGARHGRRFKEFGDALDFFNKKIRENC